MNEMEIASLKLDCLRLADGSVSDAEKKFAFVSGSKPNANAPIHAAEGNAEQAAYRTCLDTQLLKAETMNHTTAPKTLPEALNVIRAMHTDLLAFRNPEFDLIALGREGDFDDRVKSVLSHSAPVIKADRHASDCASDVLYPAIEAAMKELQSLHPGFNHAVNRAFNHLHGAFWSECPAPASAATLRPENFQAPDLSMDFGAALNALKAGGRAARTGWNGKGLWLELQVPDAKSKMTLPYIFINYPRDAQNTPGARVPWLASMTDMLADDWVLVE